jgi:hypothetical protein
VETAKPVGRLGFTSGALMVKILWGLTTGTLQMLTVQSKKLIEKKDIKKTAAEDQDDDAVMDMDSFGFSW